MLAGNTAAGFEARVLQLDLRTDTWTELEPAAPSSRPEPREGGALHYHRGALYAVGGHDLTTVFADVWRFATATPSHLVGGDALDLLGRTAVTALVLEPSPRLLRLPDLPVDRHALSAWFDPRTRRLGATFGGAAASPDDGLFEIELSGYP